MLLSQSSNVYVVSIWYPSGSFEAGNCLGKPWKENISGLWQVYHMKNLINFVYNKGTKEPLLVTLASCYRIAHSISDPYPVIKLSPVLPGIFCLCIFAYM